jgi:hypothetical protein
VDRGCIDYTDGKAKFGIMEKRGEMKRRDNGIVHLIGE